MINENRSNVLIGKTELVHAASIFDRNNKKYQFNLDVCALPKNAKCSMNFTPDEDGLKQTWEGVIWMNPPYGEKYLNGLRRHFKKRTVPKRRWFHFYQRGLIPDGSTTTSITSAAWKSISLKEG